MKLRSGVVASFGWIAISVLLLSGGASSGARQETQKQSVLTSEVSQALAHISADSLRGHLSFIASDLLEGRDTPSRGLDIAAEYIAAQFRRAGLQTIDGDSYFQTAEWAVAIRDMDKFKMAVKAGAQSVGVGATAVSLTLEGGLDLSDARLVKVDYEDSESAPDLEGAVVFCEIPETRRGDRAQWVERMRARNDFLSRMSSRGARLIISIDRTSESGAGAGRGRLIDPENPWRPPAQQGVPLVTLHGQQFSALYDSMKPLTESGTVTIRIPSPENRPAPLRNVIGVLPGSDPDLKDTYVILSAHYDHIGKSPAAGSDPIFNGANDNGSGTVSVIEVAAALSRLKQSPRRTIVFIAWFGEERGLLGARFYARNPIFPLEKTVANLNLEQLGRTDSDEGPQINRASLTGFDFSELGDILAGAGELTGIEVYRHPRNSDVFFGRSDNQALADQGVPAHTLCVAFTFPDYHAVGDHWEKIDYENMARVNRMIAVGLLKLANSATEPAWNRDNPAAERYVKAWDRLRSR